MGKWIRMGKSKEEERWMKDGLRPSGSKRQRLGLWKGGKIEKWRIAAEAVKQWKPQREDIDSRAKILQDRKGNETKKQKADKEMHGLILRAN